MLRKKQIRSGLNSGSAHMISRDVNKFVSSSGNNNLLGTNVQTEKEAKHREANKLVDKIPPPAVASAPKTEVKDLNQAKGVQHQGFTRTHLVVMILGVVAVYYVFVGNK